MFNKSRPVPSKGALRVLYQLAYISSGTAVGVAALCTEERRRRAQVLQKIADNAKWIRQSPRHVHNAALAADQGNPGAEHHGWETWRPGGSLEDCQHGEMPSRLTVRGPELPSSVQRGYEQVAGRARKRHRRPEALGKSRRTATSTNPEALPGFKTGNRDPSEAPLGTNPRWLLPPFTQPIEQASGLEQILSERHGDNESDWSMQVKSQTQPAPRWHETGLREAPRHSLDLAMAVEPTTQSYDEFSADLELFTQHSASGSVATMYELRIAHRLFSFAVKHGSLAQLRSITQWKATRSALSLDDVCLVSTCVKRLASVEDHGAILALYLDVSTNVDNASLLVGEDLNKYLVAALTVAQEALGWGRNPTKSARSIGKELLKTLPPEVSEDQLYTAVDRVCRELCSSGDTTRAASLLRAMVGDDSSTAQSGRLRIPKIRATDLAETLYASLVEHERFAICKNLLWWKQDITPPERFKHQLEQLCTACWRRESYSLLTRFAEALDSGTWSMDRIAGLNNEARAGLAMACLTRRSPLSVLDKLCLGLPEALQVKIHTIRGAGRLHQIWKQTHNLSLVQAEFEALKHSSTPLDPRQTVVSTAQITLIEIYARAGKTELALEMLYSSQGLHQSHPICLAALSLARRGEWKRVDELLQMLPPMANEHSSGDSRACLNELLRLFARKHTPMETWLVCKRLVDKSQLVPNQSTTDIMLGSFVTGHDLRLVHEWVQCLRTHGLRCELDTSSAAKMLFQYYMAFRPTHVKMMWLCRTLLRHLPSLDAAAFQSLLKESIAYDIRKADAVIKHKFRSRARANLDVLLDNPGKIGRPVPRDCCSQLSIAADSGYSTTNTDEQALEEEEEEELNSPLAFAESSHALAEASVDPALWQSSMKSTLDELLGTKPKDMDAQYARDVNDRSVRHRSFRQALERDMILALSQDEFSKVLGLYEGSLTSSGLPLSELTLEVAVDASLRLENGDETIAESMIDSARQAGLPAACATGPMLLHRMSRMTTWDKGGLETLRAAVIDHYRGRTEHGLFISHHVGTKAAYLLVKNGRPEHAVGMLTALSELVDQPFNIASMTVFLMAYASLKSWEGVRWVLRAVWQEDLRIDRKFLAQISACKREFGHTDATSGEASKRVALLRRLRSVFSQRREQQRNRADKFGDKLVGCIIRCSQDTPKPRVEFGALGKTEDGNITHPSALRSRKRGGRRSPRKEGRRRALSELERISHPEPNPSEAEGQ